MPAKKLVSRKPRKFQKKVAKAKRANENNMDTHRMVIKVSGVVNPQQGLTVSNYVYGFWSPAASYLTPAQSNPLFNSTEFNLYRNLYDQFRVSSITLKLIPRATQTESTQLAIQTETAAITQGKGVYYSVEDRDGMAPSSLQSLKKYSSVKVHKFTARLSRTYPVKYAPNQWFDCQDPAGLQEVVRSVGLNGGITVYGESFPEVKNQIVNSTWADSEITYNLVFRGKAMVQLTTQPNGDVLVSQTIACSMELPVVYAGAEDVCHQGAIDINGDLIEPPPPEPPA